MFTQRDQFDAIRDLRARGGKINEEIRLFRSLLPALRAHFVRGYVARGANSLKTYASPVIGSLSVADIDTPHVTKVLDAIWHQKPATASRVRGRIERILDWARVRGFRQSTINPARWRGHLKETYPATSKIRTVKHHAAVAIGDAATVYARLKQSDSMPALAFRFLILTAARASEVMGAKWSEIDEEARIWALPPRA